MDPDDPDRFKFWFSTSGATTGRIPSQHPALSRPPGKSRAHEAYWHLRSLVRESERFWTDAEAKAIRDELMALDYGAIERRVLATIDSRLGPPVDQMMCWFDEAESFTTEAWRKLGRPRDDRDLERFEKDHPSGELYEAVRWALRGMKP